MYSKLIVGLGGTLRTGSSTEAAISWVLRAASQKGCETKLFAADSLNLPLYVPGQAVASSKALELVSALRAADMIVLGSPGYHGGVSGLVKNAIDYTEELAQDRSPYFDGRPVGCIATGNGWQGCNTALSALRNITHSLRGWPTPIGVAINTREPVFNPDGDCLVPELEIQLRLMLEQLLGFQRPVGSVVS